MSKVGYATIRKVIKYLQAESTLGLNFVHTDLISARLVLFTDAFLAMLEKTRVS